MSSQKFWSWFIFLCLVTLYLTKGSMYLGYYLLTYLGCILTYPPKLLAYLPTSLVYLLTYLSYLSNYLSYLPTHRLSYLPTYLPTLHTYSSTYLSTYLSWLVFPQGYKHRLGVKVKLKLVWPQVDEVGTVWSPIFFAVQRWCIPPPVLAKLAM